MHIAIVVTQSLLRRRILERLAISQGGIARGVFLQELVDSYLPFRYCYRYPLLKRFNAV
jgi:hypothetical protein